MQNLTDMYINPFTTLNDLEIATQKHDFSSEVEIFSPMDTKLYLEKDLNKYCHEHKFHSNNTFSIFCANVRSLHKNFDKLTQTLDSLKLELSVIGVTESWLSERKETNIINISNYKLAHNYRKSRNGGGVGVYIHDRHNFKERTDLNFFGNDFESIFIEILNKDKKNTIIGIIYRPPNGNIYEFNLILNNTLG